MSIGGTPPLVRTVSGSCPVSSPLLRLGCIGGVEAVLLVAVFHGALFADVDGGLSSH